MKIIARKITAWLALVNLVCAGSAFAAVDFNKEIKPILQKTCYECHGPDKQKGDLRLDSRQAAFKGGKGGVSIVPGDAAKSDLYKRITLPVGNDDHMPNKGDPLTQAQTDLIRDWINQGAAWTDADDAKPAAPVTPTLAPGPKPTTAELKAIAELAKVGIDAREIAQNLHWRQASFRMGGTNFEPKIFAELKKIPSLYELDLSSIKLTDADLADIAELINLTKLHLEHTPITDGSLAHITGLTNLAYLNLFDTAITDAGLEHLKKLTNLKSLYLFQTKVTDSGIAALHKALPKLYIDHGWELPPPPKKEEKKAETEEKK